jgi:DNA-binding transcriptional LysR family regulator
MHIFARVAELSSFTQAAERLGITKASVSAAISQLESKLQTRLFFRTTRKVELTQDGRAYFERCQDLLADLEEAASMFQRGPQDVSGRLRVDMASGIAKNIVVPRLPEFLRTYPKIEMELSSTDRRVDLIREGFDCVLRVGNVVDSSLIARQLGRFRILNCVSPGYVEMYGIPRSIEDLRHHSLVHYVPVLGAKSGGFEYVDAKGEVIDVEMAGVMTVNNADAYQAACLAGLGIIQAPEVGVAELLAAGTLVEVLPEFQAEPMPVSLLYANRRYLPRRTQTFMAWIADVLRPHLMRV